METCITIAGPIGVGKSTFAMVLANRLGCKPILEAEAKNPYLPEFYDNMDACAYHSQLYFLGQKAQHHLQMLEYPGGVVQDRSIYEDAEVFCRLLYERGSIEEREYRVYETLYRSLVHVLPPPDLVLYLRARLTTLQERIRKRGRDYERNLTPGYLRQVSTLYDSWAKNFRLAPVVTVDTDELNLIDNDEHIEYVERLVTQRLFVPRTV